MQRQPFSFYFFPLLCQIQMLYSAYVAVFIEKDARAAEVTIVPPSAALQREIRGRILQADGPHPFFFQGVQAVRAVRILTPEFQF